MWSPNYAPELTGIPPLVTDACEWLAERGHEIEVVTALPNYPERRIHEPYRGTLFVRERRGRVRVSRSWVRVRPQESVADKMLLEVSFAALSAPRVARRLRSVDAVVCVVPSLAAAACAAALRGALARLGVRPRLVLWVQDLVLRAASSLNAAGPIERRVLAASSVLERVAARSADCLVACSSAFHRYLEALGSPGERIVTIPNWADLDWIAPAEPRTADGSTRFLYAGNIGYTQGFETLVDAARAAGDAVQVELVGEGNAARDVRALIRDLPNMRLRPPVPRDEFPALLASADAHLVLQREVSANANFPSKIASYFASGRPVVASIGGGTAAAEVVRESGGGIVVEPGAPEELTKAMLAVHRDSSLRERLGAAARAYAEREFDRGRALTRLERAFLG